MTRLAEHPLAASASQDNAMTEVALALAMGFFSIMVLTLISRGGGERDALSFEAVPVVAAAPDSAARTTAGNDDIIIIFDGRRFTDAQLIPVDPAEISATGDGRVVLAVAPDLTFAQVAEARRSFANADLVVTTLDARWMRRLSGTTTGGTP